MSQHSQNGLLDCSLRGFNRLLTSSRIRHASAIVLALAASIFVHPVFGQSQSVQFVKYENFMATTRSATAEDFMARPDSQVQDEATFEEMRQSILKRYEGVTVSNSFILNGDYYDCMPFEQQPAARKYGIKTMPVPPTLPPEPKNLHADPAALAANAPAGRVTRQASSTTLSGVDASGNVARCPADQVPLPRITLEALSRSSTLREQYGKALFARPSTPPVNARGRQSDASTAPSSPTPPLSPSLTSR
jgi:hypothetical protein